MRGGKANRGGMVKICGVTRREDAELAVAAGADAVGVVFVANSPRRVTPERAADLLAGLPARVLRVGVFADADAATLAAAARTAGLTHLQLHGRERPELAEELARYGRAEAGAGAAAGMPWGIWKGVAMRAEDCLRTAAEWRDAAEALLLDGAGAGRGGEGAGFEWARARQVTGARLIVAGGLRAENVAACVAATGAWGVDASSGVESAPGIKDEAKVRAFIAAARAAMAAAG